MSATSVAFVLASGSPRRRELLEEAGFLFEIACPVGVESDSAALSATELTTLNATRKAREIAHWRSTQIILAADTLVSLDGDVIGKPRDFPEAIRIIQRLRGRTHQVCTSVYICLAQARRQISFSILSHVTFRAFDDRAVVRYLEKINPLDKAGAYAAQGEGAEIIESIAGSFTNVVGLPMNEVTAALAQFGIRPGAQAGTER